MRLALFLFALPLLAAPVPEAGPGGKPLPGGVADPAGKVGFVTGADGGLDAIDLATGKKLWASNLATKAVAADGKRVVALAGKANELRVVTLDAADGKKLAESETLKLPQWAVVRLGVVASDAGRAFAVTTRLEKDALLVRWQANAWYWGGARPTPEIEQAARKSADGVARFDLASGKIDAVEKAVWPAAEPGPTVEVAGRKAVLKRPGAEPVVLLEADALRVEVADGKAMVHKAVAKQDLPPGDYAWWVFDLATGKQVAKVEAVPTTREVGLVGDRAFFVVTPPTVGRPPAFGVQLRLLRAVDLATGKTLWEHPLEPERRSPPPP